MLVANHHFNFAGEASTLTHSISVVIDYSVDRAFTLYAIIMYTW